MVRASCASINFMKSYLIVQYTILGKHIKSISVSIGT